MTREAMVEQFVVLQPRLLRLVMRQLQCAEDAEDAVQNAFLRAWRFCGAMQDEGNFQAWIMQITRNEAMNLLRKKQRLHRVMLTMNTDRLPEMDPSLRMDMEDALGRMSQQYAQAFYLREIAGYSNEEAAQRLHCPPGTVSSRLHRARKILQDELKE